MGKFLETEKSKQISFKKSSTSISLAAKEDGIFRGKPRPFCLPQDYSVENLFPPIRKPAIEYFSNHRIHWHQGIKEMPSNHLCDSMVCGVNFLFPFSEQPDALAKLLVPYYPDLTRMLPIEDGRYVAFEWIGADNYLAERGSKDGQRTRGANFTSNDAAVFFEHKDGLRQFVLIEWKYTESYSPTSLKVSKSGTDRTQIYLPLYEKADCIVDQNKVPAFEDLFYEPFYQFFRQQLLAQEMEKAKELGAEKVSLLHIAPENNLDFTRITSPTLLPLGSTATEVWHSLLRKPDRFLSLGTRQLFGSFGHDEMKDWKQYMLERYPGIFI